MVSSILSKNEQRKNKQRGCQIVLFILVETRLSGLLAQRMYKEKREKTEAIESPVNPTSNKPANTAYWQGFGWPYMHVCQLPMKVIQSNVRLALLHFSYNKASRYISLDP